MQVWFVTQDQEGHSHREKYCHALVRKHRIRFYILLSVCLHGEKHGALMVTVRFTKTFDKRFPKFATNLAISFRSCQSNRELGNEVVKFTPNFFEKLYQVHYERSSRQSVKLSRNFLIRCGYVD